MNFLFNAERAKSPQRLCALCVALARSAIKKNERHTVTALSQLKTKIFFTNNLGIQITNQKML
jgi:hypothetical protein